jgi:amino acid adenylation domain-containing protein
MMNKDIQTIHQLIATQARSMGNDIAVEFEGQYLTYSELDSRSNQLASYLWGVGVKPGVLVGLCVDRGLEMVVGLLGILKAGGAYIPIDPAYPADRIGYMLEDSQARLILTQSAIADSLPARGVQILCLDSDWSEIANSPDKPSVGRAVLAEDLAYVIYTSGSTGHPKGVEITHRALVNFIQSMCECPGLGNADRLLAVTTLSFDIAGLEIYLPLAVGARLIIASRNVAADGMQLARQLQDARITVMQATPATWRLLLEAGWHGDENMRILCGGETLTRDLAERLLPCCAELWNLYGPTETTIWSTASRVTSSAGTVPIGHPIRNTEVHVLDDKFQPVSDGEPGELYIGGHGLARGYLRREDLTAERFVPNPFDSTRGSRLYRTGDLVKVRTNDGELEHMGRLDFQVKVRGFRIELGEIEAALEQVESVRQAVVLVHEEASGDKRLVAYIQARKACAPSNRELRKAIATSLPDYMVPGYYVSLNDFPLTPNGKIDRNALPAPAALRPELTEEYLAPRNDDERKLAEIWAEVLRVEKVGVNDDFFELGGDSLKVAQIATRVRDVFTVDMSLRSMFENPTVKGLLPAITASPSTGAGMRELPISIISRDGDIPLTFSQERVWFLHQLNPRNLAYNFISTLEFRGKLDVRAVERALEEILRRHESYRTTFPAVDGKPVQLIHPATNYSLPIIDLANKPAIDQEAVASAWSQEEYQHRFDLARLPLVRWHLIRYSDDRNVLVHMEQHLVHDGWAFNLFVREFTALYQAYSEGKTSPLEEPAIQLADFATWQHAWMQGEVLADQLEYWKKKFSTVPPVLQLPTRGARPATQTFRGSSLRPEIPLPICNGLRALSREEGGTLFMTMLAAFFALLHRYTGESDVAVGTFFANRRVSASESVIGMILNNVVIRATLENNPTVRELMKQVRDVVLEDAAYQDVPFDRVVDAVQQKRDLSSNPLFQVMFSFHDEPMPEQALPGLDVSITPVISNCSSKFDLGVIGIPHSAQKLGLPQGSKEDGLTMIWEHNTDLFDTATIERMVEHYKALLAGMVENPDRRISELPLASRAECEQALQAWNNTRADYPLAACLHQLIETQSLATPNEVAVIFQAAELTYQELDRRANQLANYLVELGVGPNVLVGICVERSERMLIGLLGILKAGGAYVPIDPDFPAERQLLMIEDAQISVLVTEGGLCDSLPVDGITQIQLDHDRELLAGQPDTILFKQMVTPKDLAYVVFTSGSTGKPKGVQVSHRALVNFLSSMRERPGLCSEDSLFALTTLSFDIAGLELYLPLIVGACVIVSPRSVAINGEELAIALDATGATVMQATPSTWQMLIDSGWKGKPDLTGLCGGESLPRELAEELLPRVDNLWNMYGPTETTVWSAIQLIESGEGAIPIGRPIGNTRMYVLDQYDKLAPVGVTGELCIGGAGLAEGYLKRPELTAEKFVDNPVDDVVEGKIYRTGDLARYRADGTLECLGRIDQQIKLRGFRIELGEIESLVGQEDGVLQAAAIVREDVVGDKRIVAYYRPDGINPPNAADLRVSLRQHLPDYMVPSQFVALDIFPKMLNGKIDRRAFPPPDESRLVQEESYVAPENESQQVLALIWAEVLGVEKVGIQDDFFELGGHSLMVTRVIARIREELGCELAVSALFRSPTIAELDQVCMESQFSQIDDEEMQKMLDELEQS